MRPGVGIGRMAIMTLALGTRSLSGSVITRVDFAGTVLSLVPGLGVLTDLPLRVHPVMVASLSPASAVAHGLGTVMTHGHGRITDGGRL
jgi:hypothetical protein